MEPLLGIEQKIRKIRQQFNSTEQAYAEAVFDSIPGLKKLGLTPMLLIDVLWVCANLKPWIKTLGFQDYLDDLLASKYAGRLPDIGQVLPLLTEALLPQDETSSENLEISFLKRMFLGYQNSNQQVLVPEESAFGHRWTKIVNSAIDDLAKDSEDKTIWSSSHDSLWERAISELVMEISQSPSRQWELRLAFFVFEQAPNLNLSEVLESSARMFTTLLSIAEIRYLKGDAKINRQSANDDRSGLTLLQRSGLIFAEHSPTRSLNDWNLSESAYGLIGSRFYHNIMATGRELHVLGNMPESLQVILLNELPKSKFPWLLDQLKNNAQIFSPKAMDKILQLLISQKYAFEDIPEILEKLVKESAVPGKKLVAIQYLAQHFPQRNWQELSQSALSSSDQSVLQNKIREIHLRSRLSSFMQSKSPQLLGSSAKTLDSSHGLPHNTERFQ